MAIAFDASSTGGNANGHTNTNTWAHTCTGSDRLLVVTACPADGVAATSVTYNGVSMTKIGSDVSNGGLTANLWYLLNPASGANNIVVTANTSTLVTGCATSYTGVNQSGQPDANSSNTTTTGSVTGTVTTVADNDWVVSCAMEANQDANTSASTGVTKRNGCTVNSRPTDYLGIGDSNGVVTPAGSYSETWTFASTGGLIIIAAFKPVITTNIKSINGLAKASVKSVNGLAIASVKSFNGLT